MASQALQEEVVDGREVVIAAVLQGLGGAEKQISASANERTAERPGLGRLQSLRSPDQAVPGVILGRPRVSFREADP